jgi:ribonuclease BN (tRNA processing enzyme)
MGAMQLQFLGTGTPFGERGRLQACILLSTDRSRVLLDCGLTSLVALARVGVPARSLDAIFISHLHGDHFGGLALLLLEAAFANRTAHDYAPRARPLVVAGPADTADRVRATLEVLGWPGAWTYAQRSGSVEFVTLVERQPTHIAGLEVTAFSVPHSPLTAATALRVTGDGKTVGYSGDAGWTDTLVEVAAAADLFICNVLSFDEPEPTFLDYRTLAAQRDRLTCKRLVLTHLGQDMLDHASDLAAAGAEIAEDGLSLRL